MFILQAPEQYETFESFFYHLLWKPIFFHHLLSGSFFELPIYYVLSNLTDTDRMRVHSNIHAIPPEARPTADTDVKILIIDTQESPVGFCKLRVQQSSENAFYSRNRIGLHGPANKMPLSKWLDVGYRLIERTAGLPQFTQLTLDEVDAIFCPYWPEEAEEWFTRTSVSEWPDKNLKDHIMRRGCHLVAKSHHTEPDDSTQWRYSFSQAEIILINSWNDVQKYIYHILRVIKGRITKKCKTPEKSIFNNFLFKTLMLWASEKKPSVFWNEAFVESSIAELLVQAIECLIDRECPHYFIPKVNILDHSIDIDTGDEISSLEEHMRELQSIMSLFPNYDHTISCQLTFSKKFVVHYKLQLLSTFVINPFSSTFNRYFDTDVRNDAIVRTELETLFKALSTILQLRSSTCMAKRMSLEKIAIEYFRSCIQDDCDDQLSVVLSYGDSFYNACERLVNDNRRTTHVSMKTGSGCSECLRSDFLKQDDYKENVKRNTSRPELDVTHREKYSGLTVTRQSHKTSSSKEDKRVCDYQYQRAPVNLEKYSVPGNHTVLSSVVELIGSIVSDLYKKPSYLVSRTYCSNFYFTCIKDYRMALDLCKETLECFESADDSSDFDTRLSEDLFPIIWSCYWMPLFDESIQLVFGFLLLAITVQYASGYPMSSCYWMPPSSINMKVVSSQMLDSVIKSSSMSSHALPKKRKFQQTKLLSSLIVQVSAVEFLRYIGVQCMKQLGLGNDRLFDMRKRHPSIRRLLLQSLLLVAADSISRPRTSV